MANSNSPFGFRAVGNLTDASVGGKLQRFYKAAATAATGVGDVVKLVAGGGDAAGVPGAAPVAAADVCVGVVVGIEPNFGNLSQNYLPSGTLGYLLVNTDPNTIYEVQETTTTTAASAAGKNLPLVATAPDAVTGRSKMSVSGTAAGTATFDCQLLRLTPNVNNIPGANQIWQVRMNLNQYKASTTGI